MITFENRIGCLVEIRWSGRTSIEEYESLVGKFVKLIASGDTQRVIAADLRELAVMPPDVADRFVQLLRMDNPRVARSGYLIPRDQATLGLQFQRIIAAAAHPNRRLFPDLEPLTAWLSEALNPDESSRMVTFFHEA